MGINVGRAQGRARCRSAVVATLVVLGAAVGVVPAGATAPPSFVFSANHTLTANLSCTNLTIDRGVTLTTNGYDILCSGVVTNRGTINAGKSLPRLLPRSYGGAGGGAFDLGDAGGTPTAGVPTRAAAGQPCATAGCTPGNGAAPKAPVLTTSLVAAWVKAGSNNYLAGAAGGTSPELVRGRGSNGVVIEGATVTLGTVVADGANGTWAGTKKSAGGGGGGVIVVEYGAGGYTAGTIFINGGSELVNGHAIGVGGPGAFWLLGPANGLTPPQSQTVDVGATAIFSASATGGSPAPRVSWQFEPSGSSTWKPVPAGLQTDGSTISGTTTDTLTITNAQADEGGWSLRAVFTNADATVPTAAATLAVQWNGGGGAPTDVTADVGATATFSSADGGGSPAPTVQWSASTDGVTWSALTDGLQNDGSTDSGATTGTLTIADVQADENGEQFEATYTNASGAVTTSAATLTVQWNDGGSAPDDQSIDAGGAASFTSTPGSASPTATEQWYESLDGGATWTALNNGEQSDGSTVSGAQGPTLSITDAQPDESGAQLRAAFTNAAGTVESASANLAVQFNDGGSAPLAATATVGGGASFTSAPSGSPSPSVQWQVSTDDGGSWTDLVDGAQTDGSTVEGATTSTLTLGDLQSGDNANEYRAAFTNPAGTVDSSAATLTVEWNDGGSAPSNATATAGGGASFSTSAAGANPTAAITWQVSSNGSTWTTLGNGTQTDGSTVAGATTAELSLGDLQPADNGHEYRAVYANWAGTVTTTAASLTVEWNDGGSAPASSTVDAGASAGFTSTPASANPATAEQWQVSTNGTTWTDLANGAQGDGSTVSGATSATLTISSAQPDENGHEYRAAFTNIVGTVDSTVVTLTVNYNLGGTAPTNDSVASGGSAVFETASNGANPNATVQWQLSTNGTSWSNLTNGTQTNGSSVTGALSTTLEITSVPTSENGDEVRAAFTNSVGTVDTATASITVTWNDGGSAPTSSTVIAGNTATFSSTSAGSNPAAAEQWQYSSNGSTWTALVNGTQTDGSVVSGATTTSLSVANVQSDENGFEYRAAFNNGTSTVDTTAATLTVEWNSGGSAPANQTVTTGSTATYTSTSTGANPTPTVQWQYSINNGSSWSTLANGGQVSGATTTTLTIADAASNESGDEFRAAFTNVAGTVDSAAASLTVIATSSNWSGYGTTAETFTSVYADWTVPTLSCGSSGSYYAAQWVGIDGFGNSTVEQDGTGSDCLSGTATYFAWYELVGDSSVNDGDEVELSTTSYPVAAGDQITAETSVASNEWTFTMTDTSTAHADWDFTSSQFPYTAAQATAEWVVERPEICSPTCAVTSLADYGTTTFTNAGVTLSGGATAGIDVGNFTAIEMENGSTVLSVPGPLEDNGTSFTTTWEHS